MKLGTRGMNYSLGDITKIVECDGPHITEQHPSWKWFILKSRNHYSPTHNHQFAIRPHFSKVSNSETLRQIERETCRDFHTVFSSELSCAAPSYDYVYNNHTCDMYASLYNLAVAAGSTCATPTT